MTLCPPGACPPDNTTPIFKANAGSFDSLGFNTAEGWPNRDGKSFAISSTQVKKSTKIKLGVQNVTKSDTNWFSWTGNHFSYSKVISIKELFQETERGKSPWE